jgi:hypothetical protein
MKASRAAAIQANAQQQMADEVLEIKEQLQAIEQKLDAALSLIPNVKPAVETTRSATEAEYAELKAKATKQAKK